jgi:hypothetical protein
LWVLFAAVLDGRISDLILERGLLSYRTLARADRYTHSSGIFVPDILKHFDLPQVAAGLAGRKLTLVGPVDHMQRSVDLEAVKRCYSLTEMAFERAAGGGQFTVLRSTGGVYEAS